jgi:hypothetical protein
MGDISRYLQQGRIIRKGSFDRGQGVDRSAHPYTPNQGPFKYDKTTAKYFVVGNWGQKVDGKKVDFDSARKEGLLFAREPRGVSRVLRDRPMTEDEKHKLVNDNIMSRYAIQLAAKDEIRKLDDRYHVNPTLDFNKGAVIKPGIIDLITRPELVIDKKKYADEVHPTAGRFAQNPLGRAHIAIDTEVPSVGDVRHLVRHEYAHALQYKSGKLNDLSHREAERQGWHFAFKESPLMTKGAVRAAERRAVEAEFV